ncbi:MAG TPA: tRNA (adenosine(37)-N6)-threonylcarbamoyltransferase complex ATPase subunit type 1 TsaE [Atopostipes sp.]|nr:tRNA (adenosine(37)-N6)-threonylcarbamoyltransferase complex ATPase subunit type 1 TsaE [Atopostipes sp.]
MATIVTQNEQETIEFAKELTKYLKPGMLLSLEGDLGAGKTTFTKGIGEGLGIKRVIKSPTYTIVREYTDGKMPLYHIDLYRLDEDEVEDLGLDEYFLGDGLSVVEWPSVAPDELPTERLALKLSVDPQRPSIRKIEIEAVGKRYQNILMELNV